MVIRLALDFASVTCRGAREEHVHPGLVVCNVFCKVFHVLYVFVGEQDPKSDGEQNDISQLSDSELVERLRDYGADPGPIVGVFNWEVAV